MNDYDGKADADHGDCCMDVAMYRIVIKGLQLENAKLHAEVELAQSESRKARKRTAELAAEVERLLEERRWIPVEERLPEFEVPVFCHAYGSTWIGCRSSDEDGECWCGLLELPWYHKKGRWVVDPEFGDYKPTHWHPFPQPLPAPPAKEE